MRYLGYVETGDEAHANSVVLPDFPGCFSAADDEQNLAKAVQEAVELHFEDEDFDLPIPSTLKQIESQAGFDYPGVWMWFEIDVDKISTKLQRVNITMPKNILTKLDAVANHEHISRSGMLRPAFQRFNLVDNLHCPHFRCAAQSPSRKSSPQHIHRAHLALQLTFHI